MIRKTDIPFAIRGNQSLLLDICAPEIAQKVLRPAIVYVHGGGWAIGEKTTSCNDWLAEAGFFTVSISYRFSDVATFPAQIHDVKAAIRWVRAHAEEWHVDPDRIGIWGTSAGGHLAALCAVTNGDSWYDGEGDYPEFSSDVQCAVPICPPTEFLIDWYAVEQLPPHPEGLEVTDKLFGASWDHRKDLAQKASPHWHIGAQAAPQLIIHGEVDDLVPVSQVRAYASALCRAGHQATLVTFADEGHSVGAGIDLENADPYGLRPMITSFFQKHLMS